MSSNFPSVFRFLRLSLKKLLIVLLGYRCKHSPYIRIFKFLSLFYNAPPFLFYAVDLLGMCMFKCVYVFQWCEPHTSLPLEALTSTDDYCPKSLFPWGLKNSTFLIMPFLIL